MQQFKYIAIFEYIFKDDKKLQYTHSVNIFLAQAINKM